MLKSQRSHTSTQLVSVLSKDSDDEVMESDHTSLPLVSVLSKDSDDEVTESDHTLHYHSFQCCLKTGMTTSQSQITQCSLAKCCLKIRKMESQGRIMHITTKLLLSPKDSVNEVRVIVS